MTQRWRPSPGYLAIALVLAVGAISLLFFLWLWSEPVDAARASAQLASARAGEGVKSASAPQATPQPPPAPKAAKHAPEGDADPTRDLSSYLARGENPSVAQVIERLHERGIYSGLGAFQPPGTRPPLVGLAVPENFALPPGYVRHHQVTDDGQRIEAILMFAPGFQLYDASNQAIAMPKDGVVPPELAPPGLAIRRITIPAPLEPTTH
jgi:hypothetical protein